MLKANPCAEWVKKLDSGVPDRSYQVAEEPGALFPETSPEQSEAWGWTAKVLQSTVNILCLQTLFISAILHQALIA